MQQLHDAPLHAHALGRYPLTKDIQILYESALKWYPFGLWSLYIVLFTCYQFATCPNLPDVHPAYIMKIRWLVLVHAAIQVICIRVSVFIIITWIIDTLTRADNDYWALLRFLCLVAATMCYAQLDFSSGNQ
jgi:hypothetical protein